MVGALPSETHPPIDLPNGATRQPANPDADVFVSFVKSPAAKRLFERQDFVLLK
jgi:molybdate transport system substrate-binding protein